MRISSLLISAALGLSSPAQAQAVELFHESFSDGAATTTFALNSGDLGGTVGTGGDNHWVINNSYAGGSGTLVCLGFPFSFTVSGTPAQPAAIPGSPESSYLHTAASAAIANGINNASYIPADGTCVAPAAHFAKMTGDVSTLGMNNVALDFWWILGGSNTSYGEVYYSLDSGANWTQVTNPVASYFNQIAWIQTVLAMPEWENQPALRFGFRFVNALSTTASDPGFGIDEVRILADPANDLPIAVDDAFEVDEDATLNGDVRSNDTASGDGGNVWSLVDTVVNGSLSFVDGQFSYTPDANYNGPDSFTYQLCDIDLECDSATVTITVNPVNDLPIAADDAFDVDEDTTLNGDVRINDTPSGDGGNVWSLVDAVVDGALSFVDGQFTYTPSADYNGPGSFTYQLCDIDVDCDSATVTLTVNPVNDLPVAFDDAYQIGPDGSLDADVSVNDLTSGDGGNVWALVTPPASGTLDLAANGSFLYSAAAGFAGDVSFGYSLCDVDADCDDATVTITVSPAVIFSNGFE